MEQRTFKGLHERREDVPTSAATETNSDKDPAAPVSGTVAAALPTAEMVCFQHVFEVRKLSKSYNMRISIFASIFTCQGSQASLKLSRNKVSYLLYHSTAGREHKMTR